jgi:hypothetical protein
VLPGPPARPPPALVYLATSPPGPRAPLPLPATTAAAVNRDPPSRRVGWPAAGAARRSRLDNNPRRPRPARPPCAAARAITADPGGEREWATGLAPIWLRTCFRGFRVAAGSRPRDSRAQGADAGGHRPVRGGRGYRPHSGSCAGGRAARAPDAFRPGGDARRAAELPESAGRSVSCLYKH